MIEIRANGEPLDVRDDEAARFFITKAVHDLRQLERRESTRTNTVDLPNTGHNKKVLSLLEADYSGAYQLAECEVRINGVTMLEDARLTVLGVSSDFISVVISGGAAGFYQSLSDRPIKELDFSEYNFELNRGNLNAKINATSGINSGVGFPTTNASYQAFLNAGGDPVSNATLRDPDNERRPLAFFVKDILAKIFDSSKVDTSELEALEDYQRLALVIPYTQFFDRTAQIGAYVRLEFLDAINAPAGTLLPVPWDNPVTDTGGDFNPVTYEIEVATGGVYQIATSIVFSLTISTAITFFIQRKRGTDISYLKIWSVSPTAFAIVETSASEQVTLQAGDLVQVVYTSAAVPRFYNFAVPSGGGAVAQSWLNFQSVGGEETSLIVSNWMPETSQRELVRDVFNLFHVVVTDEGGKYKLSLFKDIIGREESNLDDNIAVGRDDKTESKLGGWAQTNYFKFADAPRVETDAFNGQISVFDNSIPKETDKINLSFAGMAPPIHELRGDLMPVFDVEYSEQNNNKISYSLKAGDIYLTYSTIDANEIKAGSIIQVGISRFYVRQVFDNRTGQFTSKENLNANALDWFLFNYKKESTPFAFCFVKPQVASVRFFGLSRLSQTLTNPDYFESLDFNYLIENYYRVLSALVAKPQILTIFCEFKAVEYLTLTPIKPIYFNAQRYYLNKAEQYKANGLVRLELIKF